MSLIESLKQRFHQLKNSRSYRRIPNPLPVKILVDGKSVSTEHMMCDWSPSGLLVESSNPLPILTFVEVSFTLGESGRSNLKLRGQVVRHRISPAGEANGMGIMFTDFSESGMAILREFFLKESTTV